MSYWLTTVVVVAIGFALRSTIGLPLLLVGFAMTVLGPFRERGLAYWPPMAAVLGFIVGYAVCAPLYCEFGGDSGGERPANACSSLIGITYTGAVNPSLLPAVYAGLLLAAVCGFSVGWMLWRRSPGT